MPLTPSTSTWPSRDSAPATPHQIYSVPFAGAGPGLGQGPPVIPSPPHDRHVPGMGTPHHRSVPLGGGGRATPATRTQDLPSSYFRPQDEDEDEEEDKDEATRRNTLANANASVGGMRVGALPIPPPSFQTKRW
jgi:hypothetical protein